MSEDNVMPEVYKFFEELEAGIGRDRIGVLADTIEKTDRKFNMSYYWESYPSVIYATGTNECGTPACLAGWTCHLFATPEQLNKFIDNMRPESTRELATALLGITDDEGRKMFLLAAMSWCPDGDSKLCSSTKETAVGMLRNFLEMGMVEWDYEKWDVD